MKVFISWSGNLSHEVAKALHLWIRLVVQATEPWISSEDIDKGAIWFSEISDQLASTSAGIVCLSSDNLESPWLLFEAGALAKGLSKSRVYTLLIDVSHGDLRPPLSQFNGTMLNPEDMFKMVKSINSGLVEKALPEEVLREAFEAHWPTLLKKIEVIKSAHKSSGKNVSRPLPDVVDEVLETCRAIHRSVNSEGTLDLTQRYLTSIRGSSPKLDARAMREGFADFLEAHVKNDPFLKMDIDRGLKDWASTLDRRRSPFNESFSRGGGS